MLSIVPGSSKLSLYRRRRWRKKDPSSSLKNFLKLNVNRNDSWIYIYIVYVYRKRQTVKIASNWKASPEQIWVGAGAILHGARHPDWSEHNAPKVVVYVETSARDWQPTAPLETVKTFRGGSSSLALTRRSYANHCPMRDPSLDQNGRPPKTSGLSGGLDAVLQWDVSNVIPVTFDWSFRRDFSFSLSFPLSLSLSLSLFLPTTRSCHFTSVTMRVLTRRVSMMNERLYGLYDSRKLFKIDFSTTRELKFVGSSELWLSIVGISWIFWYTFGYVISFEIS